MPSPVDINVVLHEQDVFRAYRGLRRENELLAATSEKAAAGVSRYVGNFVRSALPAAITVGTITSAINAGASRYEEYMSRGRVGSERAEQYRSYQARQERASNEFGRASSAAFRVKDLVAKTWEGIVYTFNDVFEKDAGRARALESLDRQNRQRENASLLNGSMLERIAAASGRVIESGMIRAEVDRITRNREINNQYQGNQITRQQRDSSIELSDRLARSDRMNSVLDVIEGVGGGASEATVRQALGPAGAYAQVESQQGSLDGVAQSLADLGPSVQQAVTLLGQIAQTMMTQAKPDRSPAAGTGTPWLSFLGGYWEG